MQLSAVLLARVIGFVETFDLNPRGKSFYPDLVKAIVSRYNFQKYPQKLEEFNESEGVKFVTGKNGNSVIEQFIIYRNGLVFDTRTSTDESKRLLEEALVWAAKECGLEYKPGMIKRWNYSSEITFYSTADFTAVHPAFLKLSNGVSTSVSEITGEEIDFSLTTFTFNHDLLTRKNPIGRFSIQRRADVPFSENKYFSEAPLPTDVHLQLISDFESDLLATQKSTGVLRNG